MRWASSFSVAICCCCVVVVVVVWGVGVWLFLCLLLLVSLLRLNLSTLKELNFPKTCSAQQAEEMRVTISRICSILPLEVTTIK